MFMLMVPAPKPDKTPAEKAKDELLAHGPANSLPTLGLPTPRVEVPAALPLVI